MAEPIDREITLGRSIVESAARLEAAGIPAARLEAEVLLARRLGIQRSGLLLRSGESLKREIAELFAADVARRVSRYPLQYITRTQEFYALEFRVDERVLIPRPETEMIVDEVLRIYRAKDTDGGIRRGLRETRQDTPSALPTGSGLIDSEAEIGRPGTAGQMPISGPAEAGARATHQQGRVGTMNGPVIVDVGTGSGCIAIAVAVNLPGCSVVATDISADALELAKENAERHGVAARIQFLEGDRLVPFSAAGPSAAGPRAAGKSAAAPSAAAPSATGPGSAEPSAAAPMAAERLLHGVDCIVSNPPYVPEHELEELQPELRHEPRCALTPGPDGMEITAHLIQEAPLVLKPGGWLLIELGAGRSAEARALLDASVWESVAVKHDLQGIPRLLVGRRRVG